MPQNEQSTPQQSTPCHFISPTMQHHHALVIQESKSLLIRFSTGSTISEAALLLSVLAQCRFTTLAKLVVVVHTVVHATPSQNQEEDNDVLAN
jgi:hypothetical protein